MKRWINRIIVLVMCMLPLAASGVFAQQTLDEYEVEVPSWYSNLLTSMHSQQEANASDGGMPASRSIAIAGIDTLISGLALWCVMFIFGGAKAYQWKGFFWFLFVFNVARFCCGWAVGVGWQVVEFLVIRSQPSLRIAIRDHFLLVSIVLGVCLYVWLIARTFMFGLSGALATTVFSHAVYIFFLFCIGFIPAHTDMLRDMQRKLVPREIIKPYVRDIERMTSGSAVPIIAYTPYHL